MRVLHAHEIQAVCGGGKGWGKITNPNNPKSEVAMELAGAATDAEREAIAKDFLETYGDMPNGHRKKLEAIAGC
ncbi:hypothetical protein [Piscinibacter sakaiensis]|uniref:hypothetical protein n=1 Tax=Piscinibacter sakaiensis TaxID=1547922 RepID=UPI003AAEF338